MKSKIFAIQIELVTKLHNPEKRFCDQSYTVCLNVLIYNAKLKLFNSFMTEAVIIYKLVN